MILCNQKGIELRFKKKQTRLENIRWHKHSRDEVSGRSEMVPLAFFCLCPFVLPPPMLKSSHQAMIPPTFLVHKKGFRDYQLKVFFCEKRFFFLVRIWHSFLVPQKRHASKSFFTSTQEMWAFFPLVQIRTFHVPKKQRLILPSHLIVC